MLLYCAPTHENYGSMTDICRTLQDLRSQCYVYYLTNAMGKEKNYMSFTHRYVFGAEPAFTGADLNYLVSSSIIQDNC
jgi:hypothetical protein